MTWLPRSLVTMAVGGVVAFGVTVRVRAIDLQAAGAIVFFAGLLYLLVNLALVGWERGWGTARRTTCADDGFEPARAPHGDAGGRHDTRILPPVEPEEETTTQLPRYRSRPGDR